MKGKTILTVIPIKEKHRELLKKIAKDAEIIFCRPEEVTQELADQAEIIQVGGQAVLGRQCHKSTPWVPVCN